MPLLEPDGANYIGVRDLPSATARYIEKLGLRKVQVELDNGENCIALGFRRSKRPLFSVRWADPRASPVRCSIQAT